MRPDALLVNASRGGVVDEAALVEALRAGRLRGAAVDVFAVEPAPADHPLLALPNVLPLPHLGASTAEAQRRAGLEAAELLLAALAHPGERAPAR
jgi:phosphoglycerate dehydrogenase-like enzyme